MAFTLITKKTVYLPYRPLNRRPYFNRPIFNLPIWTKNLRFRKISVGTKDKNFIPNWKAMKSLDKMHKNNGNLIQTLQCYYLSTKKSSINYCMFVFYSITGRYNPKIQKYKDIKWYKLLIFGPFQSAFNFCDPILAGPCLTGPNLDKKVEFFVQKGRIFMSQWVSYLIGL